MALRFPCSCSPGSDHSHHTEACPEKLQRANDAQDVAGWLLLWSGKRRSFWGPSHSIVRRSSGRGSRIVADLCAGHPGTWAIRPRPAPGGTRRRRRDHDRDHHGIPDSKSCRNHPVHLRGAVGLATIVFGASTLAWLSILALALVGAFDMVSVYIREILLQLWTPDDVRGRVNAVNSVFLGASNELGEASRFHGAFSTAPCLPSWRAARLRSASQRPGPSCSLRSEERATCTGTRIQ
jgi:hypothetical protein